MLHGDRVVLRGVHADNHDAPAVPDVVLMIRHRPVPEHVGQTGHSGRVSYPRLEIGVIGPPHSRPFANGVPILVGLVGGEIDL